MAGILRGYAESAGEGLAASFKKAWDQKVPDCFTNLLNLLEAEGLYKDVKELRGRVALIDSVEHLQLEKKAEELEEKAQQLLSKIEGFLERFQGRPTDSDRETEITRQRGFCARRISTINGSEVDRGQNPRFTKVDEKIIILEQSDDLGIVKSTIETAIDETKGIQELFDEELEKLQNIVAKLLDDLEDRVDGLLEEQINKLKEEQINNRLPESFIVAYQLFELLVNASDPSAEQLADARQHIRNFQEFYQNINLNHYEYEISDDKIARLNCFVNGSHDDLREVFRTLKELKVNWQSLTDVVGFYIARLTEVELPLVLANIENRVKDIVQKQLPVSVKEAHYILQKIDLCMRRGGDWQALQEELREKIQAFLEFHSGLPLDDVDRLNSENLEIIRELALRENFDGYEERISQARSLLELQRNRRENIIGSIVRSSTENTLEQLRAILRPYVEEIDNEDLSLNDIPDLFHRYRPQVENKGWAIYASLLVTYFERSDLEDDIKEQAISDLRAAIDAYNANNRELAEECFARVPGSTFFGYATYPSNVEELQRLTAQIQNTTAESLPIPEGNIQELAQKARKEYFHSVTLFMTHFLSTACLNSEIKSFATLFAEVKENENLADRRSAFFNLLQQEVEEKKLKTYQFQIAFFFIKILSNWIFRILDRSALPIVESVLEFIQKIDVVVDALALALLEHNRAWEDAKNTSSANTVLPDEYLKKALRNPAVGRGDLSSKEIQNLFTDKVIGHMQFVDLSASVTEKQDKLNNWADNWIKRVINVVLLRQVLNGFWLPAKIVDRIANGILQKGISHSVKRYQPVESLLQSVGGEGYLTIFHQMILEQLDLMIKQLQLEGDTEAIVVPQTCQKRKIGELLKQFTQTFEIYNELGELGLWQSLKSLIAVGAAQSVGVEPLAEALSQVVDRLKKGEKRDAFLWTLFSNNQNLLVKPVEPECARTRDFWKEFDKRLAILAAEGQESKNIPLVKRAKIELLKKGFTTGGRMLYAVAVSENVAKSVTNHLLYKFSTA
ncbi:MAG: hypothetical protein ChlgKO_00280 [Chlamydiales bacterium]